MARRTASRRQRDVAGEIRRLGREQLGLDIGADDEGELASRLDSLALLSLVVAVEDRFRIALTEEDAAAARSLADLARIVADRAPAETAP